MLFNMILVRQLPFTSYRSPVTETYHNVPSRDITATHPTRTYVLCTCAFLSFLLSSYFKSDMMIRHGLHGFPQSRPSSPSFHLVCSPSPHRRLPARAGGAPWHTLTLLDKAKTENKGPQKDLSPRHFVKGDEGSAPMDRCRSQITNHESWIMDYGLWIVGV